MTAKPFERKSKRISPSKPKARAEQETKVLYIGTRDAIFANNFLLAAGFQSIMTGPIYFRVGGRGYCKRIGVVKTEDILKHEKELKDNGIPYDDIHMRTAGDKREDSIIKREMLDKIVKEYYIVCVFDDRNRVVEMWRDAGLKCLQVADGDF